MNAAVRRVRAHPRASVAAGVVVLVAAASGAYFGTRDTSASAAVSSIRTETVSTGTVKQTVSATGTLAPAHEEQLNFAVSGQVTKVAVSTGQRVAKGQALATVDSASLAASVAQAKASVASARAKVDSDNSSGVTDTQLAADRAALTAAKNQLASAKRQLAGATLTSPIAGVVAAVNLTVGQSVSGSGGDGSSSQDNGSSDPTSAQVLVISTNAWIVNATVDASSVGLIKVTNQAQLTITGASETVYGTVGSIGLVSSSSSSSSSTGTASYPVVIDVTGSPAGLHDGADVTAAVTYKQASGLVISTLALHRTSAGNQYVEQVKSGKTFHATVQTGLSSGGQTIVTSGLTEGAQIRVPQLQVSRNGNGSSNGQLTRGVTNGNFPGGGTFPGGVVIPGQFGNNGKGPGG